MNLDCFFNKQYNERNYNCLHFIADIWKHLTGKDVYFIINEMMNNSKISISNIQNFKVLSEPETPCIVVMRRANCTPHVGIYIDRKIIHITEQGVECLDADIACRGFKKVGYLK